MAKAKLYLSSWINFGKYRENPRTLKDVADTAEGREWLRWLGENSWNFELDHTVETYINLQEENDRYVLQPSGSK